MKLLITAATYFEFFDFKTYYDTNILDFSDKGIFLDFLVTGVGSVPTIFNLMKADHENYDGIIQMGIAGSFRESLRVGDVIQVESEVFGDVGAEEADGSVLDMFELNLWSTHEQPFDNKVLFESEVFPFEFSAIRKVHGLTVNVGSGNKNTIAARRKKFASDVESMEGAPFFYFSQLMHVPCRQVRCISNPITERDTSQWQIKKAIQILNEYMIDFFLKIVI